jgi:lysyl-tRNA synthetase class 2
LHRIETLHLRHRLLREVRAFFDARDFVEVETPALVRSPGTELHLEAFEVVGARELRWLAPSPELHMKRLLCEGAERVYQVCHVFRRGELGALHEPEFTMLEWYRAHAGSAEVMRDTEDLVARLARAFSDGAPCLRRGERRVDVTPPFERLSVREAFTRYASVRLDDVVDEDDHFYRVLVDEIEPRLGVERPTFLTRYPARMASLARLHPDDPTTADRFELYAAGVELCNGFGELTDPHEQRARIEREQDARRRAGRPVYPIDEAFLAALVRGMPPSGGNALGLDRLLMLLTGADRVADVVAFPAGLR